MLTRTFLNTCQRLLIAERWQYRYFSSVSSSSIELNNTMKSLIDARKYRAALDLFDRQHRSSTDTSLTFALKACTKLGDLDRGIRIHQQLSGQSLTNPFIQTSLIHFYSRSEDVYFRRVSLHSLVQCRDFDRAHRLFTAVENKTVMMYGALFKGQFDVLKDSPEHLAHA